MIARIYVGTYAKYNSGSIGGKWLDLEDYANAEYFLKACVELHKDESDPELMFQDFEGFPRDYYSESSNSDKLESVFAWLELNDDDRELLTVYLENVADPDSNADIEQARKAYLGHFNSPADWAADWLEQTGDLNQVPEHLRNYFDYEAYARDAQGDVTFVRHNGDVWVFSNN
jgi:antirestriction protein